MPRFIHRLARYWSGQAGGGHLGRGRPGLSGEFIFVQDQDTSMQAMSPIPLLSRSSRPAVAARSCARRKWGVLLCTTVALAGGCADQPEAPIVNTFFNSETTVTAARLDALLPTDVLLLGEQHDAREHQRLEQQVIAILAGRGLLAAVALEMAPTGTSTEDLKPSASEEQTRRALEWSDKRWSWAAYAPAVMTAVRAGVPVLGANLPRGQFRESMAERELDTRLPAPTFNALQQAVRTGHCNLLPEEQIKPLTRVQIAKDITMADTVRQAALPGKVVVLLTGHGHADRSLGVPLHLSADLRTKAIRLQAENDKASAAQAFDSTWRTPALPDKDHCAELQERLARRAANK